MTSVRGKNVPTCISWLSLSGVIRGRYCPVKLYPVPGTTFFDGGAGSRVSPNAVIGRPTAEQASRSRSGPALRWSKERPAGVVDIFRRDEIAMLFERSLCKYRYLLFNDKFDVMS